MMTRNSRRAIACALLTTTALCCSATAEAATPAPEFLDTIDDHSVDLVSGLPVFSVEEGGIGAGPGRVALKRTWAEGAGFVDNWSGGLYAQGANMVVNLAGISDVFTPSGSNWISAKGDGATLVYTPTAGIWVYTARDGTQITFSDLQSQVNASCPGATDQGCQHPISILRPDGMKFTLSWFHAETCTPETQNCSGLVYIYDRLSKVSSSAGYSLTFTYAGNTAITNMNSSYPWFQRTGVTFTNSANVPSPVPAISYAYPTSGEVDVTDPASRTWKFFTDSSGRLTGIERPGSSSNNISYAYGADGTINSATKDGVTNTYSRSIVGTTATERLTNPLSQQTVVTSDTSKGRPTSLKDGNNHTTTYAYDANTRLTQVTAPEGNYVQYGYDTRGNLTTTTNVAKSGSGLSTIITSASFDATCANVVKCNKPNSTTDAKGNVTTYTYDPTHGGVLTITQPAPTTGAVQPQTRYSYAQVTSASGDLVYMLTAASACRTTASCTGTADESKTTTSYNSNLLPTSVTKASGNGALSATTAYTYDSHGNVTSVDGPLSGTADTTAYKYDSADQRVGTISPDPDGAGSLLPAAIRLTYRADGQISKQEVGTVTDQSDAAWANFSTLRQADITFDSNSRPITSQVSASGTAYSLIQTSYDALGRVSCTAVRMNAAVYGSLPASACTLSTQGGYGPDQISQNSYDNAGQLTQVQVGVGTAAAANQRTMTYTNNGKLQTLTDGENNKTTYVYDGFDRLSQTQFPSPTKGAGTSNSADYEQPGYDANGNRTSLRRRDGQTLTFTFDNLNRIITKVIPDGCPLIRPSGTGCPPTSATRDVYYAYDNLGRLTAAKFDSQSGADGVTNAYDAFGRLTSSTTSMAGFSKTISSVYDLDNNLTQTTQGDGQIFTYTYDVRDRLTGLYVGAGTSTSLETMSWNNDDTLNTRSDVAGTSASYSWDPAGRLSGNGLTFSSVPADNINWTLTRSPSNQITSESRSNDSYAYGGTVSVNRAYAASGLNQYTTAGPATFTYDAAGNLTSDGTNSYIYDGENRLVSATAAGVTTNVTYDPLGRLWQVDKGTTATTTKFIYDRDALVMEYDGSNNFIARYVHGNTADSPLVSYVLSSGTWKRYFLNADHLGTITALTGDSGSILINTYDEYGVPASSNSGRFQYTGQAWISELGMYYYKARMYSSTLGRFYKLTLLGLKVGSISMGTFATTRSILTIR